MTAEEQRIELNKRGFRSGIRLAHKTTGALCVLGEQWGMGHRWVMKLTPPASKGTVSNSSLLKDFEITA